MKRSPSGAGAALTILALVAVTAPADAAAAPGTLIPLAALGYRDGVTLTGVAPSVTFDLPRYASLRAATLQLDLHVAPAAGPDSTVAVLVDGTTVARRPLRELGHDARLVVPLPLPASETLAVTVSGNLRVAGDPCAADVAHALFLRIGRDSAFIVQAAPGGGPGAFFQSYGGTVDVSGPADDPELVAVPYRIDRLEPWHRVDEKLVAAPQPGRRTVVLTRDRRASRTGDVLHITPAALAALPLPSGQSPERHAGSVTFADLHQHLGSASGTGDLAFGIPLPGSVVGGVPQGLRVHVAVAHTALPATADGTLQVLINGVLIGAHDLARGAVTETMDVAVPASVVGASNELRVLLATTVPDSACGAGAPITATLLDGSSFAWSGVDRRPASIESFLTALDGRVVVLVTPEFTRAAFHFMVQLGKLNAAITRLDVVRFTGSIPDGYDGAIVFAPPEQLADLQLPIKPREPAFTVVNPLDGATVLHAGAKTTFDLLQLTDVRGTPVLAVSYHGDSQTIHALETVDAQQLATQVAVVTVVASNGATAYDIGEKLRVRYADDETAASIWLRVRLAVALTLVLLIAAAGAYASRRLTGPAGR